MQDLIKRIEAATIGSLDLDRAVLAHLGYSWRGMAYWKGDGPTSEMWRGSALLTRSIDGALSLVPDGFEWRLEYQAGHHVSCEFECMIAIAKLGDPSRGWESIGYTPALALCAAALKASAYLKETNNAD